MKQGRFINSLDLVNNTKNIVIGNLVANDLFGDIDPIGKYLDLNKIKFKVVGVFVERSEGTDSNEARIRITDGTSATTPYRLVNYDSDGNYLSFNPCLNWYWTKSHTAGTTVTITPQFRNTNGSGNIIWGDNGDTTMMIIQEIAR